MASWTDTKTPTFNPYIEQLPISAMVQVGEAKQQQYNQGIQKIQTQIDNVAGLDVMRDVDKNYLQSKLNNLGTQLKSVAAADFSNNQLVTSTAGMAAQIGKDPTIQSAVVSTQKVRTALNEKENAKQTGKGSPENEWDLNNQINGYVNDRTPGASFIGGYNPYVDVNKKMQDAYSKLKEQGSDIEDPFQKDGKGNYITDAKGNKVMSPVIVETILKGNSSSKIANAIRATLDQNDLKQMDITGRYAYRGVSNDYLKQDTLNTYTQRIADVKSRIAKIQEMAVIQSGNPTATAELTKTLKELNDEVAPGGYYEQQLKQAYNSIDTNPEAVKAQLYKDKTIAAFADSYANETETVKFLESPYEKVKEWGLDYSQRNLFHNDQMAVDYANIATARDRLAFDQLKYKMEHSNTNPTVLGGLVPRDIDYYESVKGEVAKNQAQLKDADNKLRDGMVSAYKQRPGITDKDVEAYKASLTSDKISALIKLKDSPDPKYATTFPPSLDDLIVERKEISNNLESSKNAIISAENDVKNDPILQAKVAGLSPIQIEMPDGSKTMLSPQDTQSAISSIISKLAAAPQLTTVDFMANLLGITRSSVDKKTVDNYFNYAKDNLTPVEMQLYKEMNRNTASNLGPINHNTYPGLNDHLTIHKDFIDARNKALAKLVPEYVPKWKEIDDKLFSKETLKTTAANLIAANVQTHTRSSSYDRSATDKLLSNKTTDLNFKVARNNDETFLAVSKSGDSGSTQMIPISEELANSYGMPSNADDKFLGRMMKNGGTTNTKGGTPDGAYIQHSTDKYRIAIDYKPSAINNNKVYPIFRIMTSHGWDPHELKDAMDLTQARLSANKTYSNEAIEKILKDNDIKL